MTAFIESLQIFLLMGLIKQTEQRLLQHSKESLESDFRSQLNVEIKSLDKGSLRGDQSKAESFGGGRNLEKEIQEEEVELIWKNKQYGVN